MSLYGPTFLPGVEGYGPIKTMQGEVPDQILLTIGSRKALRYSLENTAVVSQYFCPSYINLTTPLSWNPTTKQYCCVVNDTNFLSWDGAENHLEKVATQHSFKLISKAVDILSSTDELHILFENGSLQSVSYLKKKKMAIESDVLPKGSKIIQSRLIAQDGLLFLIILYQNENTDSYSSSTKTFCMFRVTVDPETKQTRLFRSGSFEIPPSVKSEQCGVSCDGFFIDSDGNINRVTFGPKEPECRFVGRIEKQSLNRKISIAAIDENHICLIGDQVGADGSYASIINVIYGIELSGQRLKVVSEKDDELVLAAEGQLLLKHGSRVASLICEDLPGRLSDVVGSKIYDNVVLNFPEQNDDELSWKPVGELSQTAKLYQVLPDLLMSQNVREVDAIVESHSEIPELLVLNIIEMYLTAPEKLFSKVSKCERKDLILKAFLLPISDLLMVQHLRQVAFSIVCKMLSFLIEELVTSTESGDSNLEQILSWISLIINAHFCNFILAKDEDCKEQLNVALALVNSLNESLQSIGMTLPLIKMIMSKQQIRPAVSQKVYNIEVVDL